MATKRTKILKELHRLFQKADKLYDGQVEFGLGDGDQMSNEEVLEDEEKEEECEKEGGEEEEEEEGDDNNENFLKFSFFVTPNKGSYRRARIEFQMNVDTLRYPRKAPWATCRDKIYHPNIDYMEDDKSGADVCVSLLEDDWEPGVGLDGAVMAVLFLFYHPNMADPVSAVCCEPFIYQIHQVRPTLRGGAIGYYRFDKLLHDSTDSDTEEGECLVPLHSIEWTAKEDPLCLSSSPSPPALSKTAATIPEDENGATASAKEGISLPITHRTLNLYSVLISYCSQLKDFIYRRLQNVSDN